MTILEIALLIIAAAFAILVLTLIPAIIKLKRAASSVSDLADMLQNDLKPTIKELNELLTELKTVGGGIAERTDDVKCFMSALGETGDNLHAINRSVGVVTTALNAVSIWATGAKVAGKFLMEKYLTRKGGIKNV